MIVNSDTGKAENRSRVGTKSTYMNRSRLYYGWIPDLPDHRDRKFSLLPPSTVDLPLQFDVRDGQKFPFPPVYDQGLLGSCTANAIAGAFEFELLKQGLKDFTPSRLFIYYNERIIENSVNTDAGAEIRNGIKAVALQGVCDEKEWPYVISEFTKKPYESCYLKGLTNLATSYYRIDQDINQMKRCLADGYPFVFGFSVFPSFESARVTETGIVNMPLLGESVMDGHAVMAVGYDDTQKRFIVRNSWGPVWGMQGYFTIPYDYLINDGLAGDFWTIRLVSGSSDSDNAAVFFNEKNEQLNIADVKTQIRDLSTMAVPTLGDVETALKDYYNLAMKLQTAASQKAPKLTSSLYLANHVLLPGFGGKILAEIKKVICGILDGNSTHDTILEAVLNALAGIIPGGIFIESLARIVVKYILSLGITNFCQTSPVITR